MKYDRFTVIGGKCGPSPVNEKIKYFLGLMQDQAKGKWFLRSWMLRATGIPETTLSEATRQGEAEGILEAQPINAIGANKMWRFKERRPLKRKGARRSWVEEKKETG